MRVRNRWCWVAAALALYVPSSAVGQMKADVISVEQAESSLLELSDAAVLLPLLLTLCSLSPSFPHLHPG